jgi:hypothetical protein
MYMLGMISINAASLAQLKCTGDRVEHGGTELKRGSTACSQMYWEWLGCTGSDGGIDSEQGMSTGVDGIINNMARV